MVDKVQKHCWVRKHIDSRSIFGKTTEWDVGGYQVFVTIDYTLSFGLTDLIRKPNETNPE